MNVVDLNDTASLELYRASMIADIPDLVGQLGFAEQAADLYAKRYDKFVEWVTTRVAIEGHGATENAIGLTTEQTRIFNPFAIEHRLMGPVELWTPGEAIPENAGVGEIKSYETFPELFKLLPDAYKARRSFIVGALFRGVAGRVDAAITLAEHNELLNQGQVYDFVALTGERSAQEADLGGGAYKDFYPEATDDKAHDMQMMGDEADMFLAQFRGKLDLEAEPFMVVDDHRPLSERIPPVRPGMPPRTWIVKKYRGTLQGQPDKPVTVTIVNGEAYPPEEDQLNRSKWGPKATAVLSDWLEYAQSDPSQIAVYNISYAHMLRIAAALYKEGRSLDSHLGSVIPVGNMPLENTWYTVNKKGYQNGGTLGWKEMLAVIRNINALVGREQDDLTRS